MAIARSTKWRTPGVNVTYMSDADYRAEITARKQSLGLTTDKQQQ